MDQNVHVLTAALITHTYLYDSFSRQHICEQVYAIGDIGKSWSIVIGIQHCYGHNNRSTLLNTIWCQQLWRQKHRKKQQINAVDKHKVPDRKKPVISRIWAVGNVAGLCSEHVLEILLCVVSFEKFLFYLETSLQKHGPWILPACLTEY